MGNECSPIGGNFWHNNSVSTTSYHSVDDSGSTNNVATTIDDSCRLLEKKLKYFNEQIDINTRKARTIGNRDNKKGTKKQAIYYLKLNKLYEKHCDRIIDIQLQLAGLKLEISTAMTISTVVTSLDHGNKVLKTFTSAIDACQVENIMDDLKESIDQLNDTSNILSEDLGDGRYNDKELEKELKQLMKETPITSTSAPDIEVITISSNNANHHHKDENDFFSELMNKLPSFSTSDKTSGKNTIVSTTNTIVSETNLSKKKVKINKKKRKKEKSYK